MSPAEDVMFSSAAVQRHPRADGGHARGRWDLSMFSG